MRKAIVSLLAIIILFSLGLRLYLAFSTDYLNDDSSYFTLRQIEYISDNKVPLFHDDLSYSGRFFVFSPIYHYILAFFTIFLPIGIVVKLIPNLIATLIIPVVFLLTRNITKNDFISFFTAFASIFIPVFFKETYNSLSPVPLVLLITFMLLYFMLEIKKYIAHFVIGIIFLSMLSPLAVVLIVAMLIYLLLCKLAAINNMDEEREIIIFSTFFAIWLQFIIYKNAILTHSFRAIWQNVPKTFLKDYFTQFTIPEAIYLIGFLIFLSAIYVIYNNIFSDKNRKIYLIFSLALSSILLLWFKLIPYNTGLIFLGFVFVVLFGYFLFSLFDFMKKIHMEKYNNLLTFIIIVMFILGSILPTLIETYKSIDAYPNEDDIELFKWASTLPEGSVVLVPVQQAHTFTYFSGKKNVMDSNFLLITDVEERNAEIDEVYKGTFKNDAIRVLNNYDVDYLAFTNLASDYYGIDSLPYIDKDCFLPVYEKGDVVMYKSLCKIEVTT